MLKYWNISVLLDYCEIDYTEKQVMKLEKLLNTFLKKYIIKIESERDAQNEINEILRKQKLSHGRKITHSKKHKTTFNSVKHVQTSSNDFLRHFRTTYNMFKHFKLDFVKTDSKELKVPKLKGR